MKNSELSRNLEILGKDIAFVARRLNEEMRDRAHLTSCSQIDDMDDRIAQDIRTLTKFQEELKELRGERKEDH